MQETMHWRSISLVLGEHYNGRKHAHLHFKKDTAYTLQPYRIPDSSISFVAIQPQRRSDRTQAAQPTQAGRSGITATLLGLDLYHTASEARVRW